MRRLQRVLEYFPKIWDFIPPQTGLFRSMLRPLNLGPGGRSYNEPISHLHWSDVDGNFGQASVSGIEVGFLGRIYSLFLLFSTQLPHLFVIGWESYHAWHI